MAARSNQKKRLRINRRLVHGLTQVLEVHAERELQITSAHCCSADGGRIGIWSVRTRRTAKAGARITEAGVIEDVLRVRTELHADSLSPRYGESLGHRQIEHVQPRAVQAVSSYVAEGPI